VANGRLLRFATVGAVLLLGLACAACGRRGPLEEPPVITAPTADAATTPAKKPARAKRTPITKPTGGFILDPLL
jgi:predicted small lipoprotein YifL